jgi:hypothetical protein
MEEVGSIRIGHSRRDLPLITVPTVKPCFLISGQANLPVSPEEIAMEEQTPEEGSLKDDLKEGLEEERVGLSLMKCMGYEEDARRCILTLGSGST